MTRICREGVENSVLVPASKQGLKSLLDHHPELFVSLFSFPCSLDFHVRKRSLTATVSREVRSAAQRKGSWFLQPAYLVAQHHRIQISRELSLAELLLLSKPTKPSQQLPAGSVNLFIKPSPDSLLHWKIIVPLPPPPCCYQCPARELLSAILADTQCPGQSPQDSPQRS